MSRAFESDGEKYVNIKNPTVTFRLQHKEYIGEEKKDICGICHDTIISEGKTPCQTICNHLFHRDCLNEWTVEHNTCPICRENFYKEETMANVNELTNYLHFENIDHLVIHTDYLLRYSCDQCQRQIAIERYHLLNSNYDLCIKCYNERFNKVEEIKDDFIINNINVKMPVIDGMLKQLPFGADDMDNYVKYVNPPGIFFNICLPSNISSFDAHDLIFRNNILKANEMILLSNSMLGNVAVKSTDIRLINCDIFDAVELDGSNIECYLHLHTNNISKLLQMSTKTAQQKMSLIASHTIDIKDIDFNMTDEEYKIINLSIKTNMKKKEIITVNRNSNVTFARCPNLNSLLIENLKFYEIFPISNTITSLVLDNAICRQFDLDLSSFNNLLTIKLSNMYIGTISNLPDNLVDLTVTNCHLKQIVGPLPKNLKTLNLSQNDLHDIPNLTVAKKLKMVNLSYNKLKTIYIPTSVIVCDITNNLIEDIVNKSLYMTLVQLYCSHNKLSKLPAINYLHELICSYNKIRELTIADDCQMTVLECSNNILTEINTSGFGPNLRVFDCSHNRLSNIPPLAERIDYFDCSKNRLTTLANTIKNTRSLQLFNCSNNMIEDLNLFGKTIYNHINCSNNRLKKIIMNPHSDGISVTVNVSYNKDANELSIPWSTRNLNIKHTKITTIRFLSDYVKLYKFVSGKLEITNKLLKGSCQNINKVEDEDGHASSASDNVILIFNEHFKLASFKL